MAQARIVRQSLRLHPVAQTYGPTEWGPAFSSDLRGPVPSGSQVLPRGEKARQFNERPRPGCRYYTTGKKEIETPEELAAAAVWSFEGSEDQGLITEKWTVLGLHFDADHALRETTETNGFGTRAPSAAFP